VLVTVVRVIVKTVRVLINIVRLLVGAVSVLVTSQVLKILVKAVSAYRGSLGCF
jgi:hypothetical protein